MSWSSGPNSVAVAAIASSWAIWSSCATPTTPDDLQHIKADFKVEDLGRSDIGMRLIAVRGWYVHSSQFMLFKSKDELEAYLQNRFSIFSTYSGRIDHDSPCVSGIVLIHKIDEYQVEYYASGNNENYASMHGEYVEVIAEYGPSRSNDAQFDSLIANHCGRDIVLYAQEIRALEN